MIDWLDNYRIVHSLATSVLVKVGSIRMYICILFLKNSVSSIRQQPSKIWQPRTANNLTIPHNILKQELLAHPPNIPWYVSQSRMEAALTASTSDSLAGDARTAQNSPEQPRPLETPRDLPPISEYCDTDFQPHLYTTRLPLHLQLPVTLRRDAYREHLPQLRQEEF